ncbi:hypothetical protein RclHR1_06580010 [Rhizophagus clarus]|uniref:Uncharacterized protein n=1 Tax=Rhizophagus clarus TaxID=94130 RepID=A0A2Z6RSB8_9GLOM|nr:hypothetical protein RclHR1_06580010 [Rhizophagus clarus]
MQNSKRFSYCPAIRSKMVHRHSYPGSSSDKERIQKLQVDVENFRRLSNTSNTSLSSHDSGVGLSKADYEIQRALRAQRVLQRPHIIVLHKGRPVSHSAVKNLNNHEEFEANIVVAAATASKRNRREISVMHKRQTIFSVGNNYNNAENLGRLKNNSAPNLYQSTQPFVEKVQKISQEEVKKEKKDNKEVKDQIPKNSSFMPKPKLLFRSVSLSIKKLMGIDKEKKRRSQLIKHIHLQPNSCKINIL